MGREVTQEEWFAEGEKLYGKDKLKWKFKCPVCGHVASAQDWKDAGAESGEIAFSCIGRLLEKKADALDTWSKRKDGGDRGPCNYAGGGLFRLNPVTVTKDGESSSFFEFADHVEEEENAEAT